MNRALLYLAFPRATQSLVEMRNSEVNVICKVLVVVVTIGIAQRVPQLLNATPT